MYLIGRTIERGRWSCFKMDSHCLRTVSKLSLKSSIKPGAVTKKLASLETWRGPLSAPVQEATWPE